MAARGQAGGESTRGVAMGYGQGGENGASTPSYVEDKAFVWVAWGETAELEMRSLRTGLEFGSG